MRVPNAVEVPRVPNLYDPPMKATDLGALFDQIGGFLVVALLDRRCQRILCHADREEHDAWEDREHADYHEHRRERVRQPEELPRVRQRPPHVFDKDGRVRRRQQQLGSQ